MNELSQKVIELEKEYFDIIQELFYDLILVFEKENISIEEAVNKYLIKQRQSTIFIPNYKDNHSFKRKQLFEKDMDFWNKNKNILIDFISAKQNVGVFGVGDNTFTSDYLEELKRNSLYYNVLVFNDPFYTPVATDKESDFDSNISMFYRNILYIWEIKRYLSVEENEIFTIIFPFNSLITYEEETKIIEESYNAANSWINELFGISTGKNDLIDSIEKIKHFSIEKIQEELYKNGIYQNYVEALNYSQNLLGDDIKREIEKFCFESWGTFNKDFVRCLLTLEALPSMATVNYYTYKLHFLLTMRLKSNPIMPRNEWAPMKRELKNQSLNVSSDYMYTCAIHRNDQMAALVELGHDEIIQYHNRKQCADFRDFFNKATNEIVNTHVNVDEIANEVFSKTDSLLKKEYNEISLKKQKTKKKAIIGFMKGALGFVPILSYAISAFDMGVSSKDYIQIISNKETLIEHLNTRNNK